MKWIKGPPSVEQAKLHEKEHSCAGYERAGLIKVMVPCETQAPAANETETEVKVKNVSAGSYWLQTNYQIVNPHIVKFRVIKGVVHYYSGLRWRRPTGDWLNANYLPVNVSGIPVEYKEAESEVD